MRGYGSYIMRGSMETREHEQARRTPYFGLHQMSFETFAVVSCASPAIEFCLYPIKSESALLYTCSRWALRLATLNLCHCLASDYTLLVTGHLKVNVSKDMAHEQQSTSSSPWQHFHTRTAVPTMDLLAITNFAFAPSAGTKCSATGRICSGD
jgi:hypothetical protein